MINKQAIALIGVVVSLSSVAALAADPDAGRVKAEPCLACHFADDFRAEAERDILALIAATRAPDSGHPSPSVELDENDMADIAAFFARGE